MRRLPPLLVASFLAAQPALAAQGGEPLEVRGLVLDERGDPASGTAVMLHRMSERDGGLLAQDTTDGSGRFVLSVPLTAEPAVHFAAASTGGVLFVGPLLNVGGEAPDPYVIRVRAGIAPGSVVLEDGSVLAPEAFGPPSVGSPTPTPPATPDARRTSLVFLGVVALLAAGALLLRDGARARALRRALLELAELRDAEPTPPVEERRLELRERAHSLRSR
ncbi:MAG TPA: hypothetical protein VML95_11820 [Longimicrobiales bacterium]|nr:hypothetical protein [Longimicrobiales bacterium]